MKQSAGLLLFRMNNGAKEFFLVHPGGPFWKNKDDGAWSIPKGEFTDGELPLDAAKREFEEETGVKPVGMFQELTPVRLRSGKTVFAWAVELDIDAASVKSNTFPLEWPPKSGKFIQVPEIDRAGWFDAKTATAKLNGGQLPFIKELLEKFK